MMFNMVMSNKEADDDGWKVSIQVTVQPGGLAGLPAPQPAAW